MAEAARELHRAYYPSRLPQSRDPLLLLNSLATTTEIWRPLLAELTAVTSVLCLDYPGHGRSPARGLPADLDELSRQILQVMDTLGVHRVHVAGVSIGGMSALRLADMVPDRISSITVIGSTPVMDAALWRSRKDIVQHWGTRDLVPDVIRRWFTPEFCRAHPDIVAEYSGMLESTADSAYAAFSDVLAASDLRERLSGISCPTLIVSGTHDPAATVADGESMAARIPGARFAAIDGAAHMLQAMAPARVAELIVESVLRGEQGSARIGAVDRRV
ncbi:3-oxoadipate enol-lactonase [Micromonospora pallida]|uniref:3-oxoadipate enol-lactonase n=1 Tax=Micromonospora pallida TaxID=145854 RepID=A0A1C6SI77_9ACTN|nr:alpha/beta fold hydrolase [Micromonospora pallida]SCL29244.1 3-oxoadipate enol-lactonase [Micromonospora pallida]